MATRTEIKVVYVAGLVQGIVLVTFPAASTIFTDPDEYDLSSSAYGTMFLPQVTTAIAGALLGAGLARRFGAKRVYLAGLALSLAAMVMLVTSTLLTDELLARLRAAAGGDGVPRGRLRAGRAPPQHVHRGVPPRRRSIARCWALNALLGLGTALAPVFVAIFVGLGFWWGLPVLSAVMLVALSSSPALRLPLHSGARARRGERGRERQDAASRRASGSSPPSRCSTASARR